MNAIIHCPAQDVKELNFYNKILSNIAENFSGLLKSAGIVVVGTILSRALGLVGEILVVRSLSPKTYGLLALAYTIVLAVSRVTVLGIPDAVTRLASADTELNQVLSIIRCGVTIVLGSTALAVVLLYNTRENIANLMGDPQLVKLLGAFSLFVLVMPLSRVAVGILRAQRRSSAAVIANDLIPRSGSLAIFTGLTLIGLPFAGAISYWVLLPFFSLAVATVFVARQVPVKRLVSKTPSTARIREVWEFSWPLAVASSFVLFLSTLDVLMIGYFMESDSVGYYRSVQPLRQVTTFVLSAFVFLYLPIATTYYANNELDNLDEFYVTTSKWISIATLPLVLVFSVFSQDVIRTFLGQEYIRAAPILTILVIGLYFNALVGPNGATVKAIGKPRFEMVAGSAGFGANLLLNALLIPRYGIVGAAVATVFGYICYNSLEILLLYRQVGIHPFTFNTLKPIIPTVLFTLVVAVLLQQYKLQLYTLILLGCLIALVTLLATVFTRSLSETDILLVERAEEQTGFNLAGVRAFLEQRIS